MSSTDTHGYIRRTNVVKAVRQYKGSPFYSAALDGVVEVLGAEKMTELKALRSENPEAFNAAVKQLVIDHGNMDAHEASVWAEYEG